MNASVKLIESVVPTTVALHVRVRPDHPSAKILGAERKGTGTIIDASGLILTVNYVVLGADTLTVTLLGGETMAGKVIAHDFVSGLAVIRVDAKDVPVLPLSSSITAHVGDEIFIVAADEGDERRLSTGGITSTAPFEAYWEYSIERAIISSAPNLGQGGGPMVDRHGHMIGVAALDLNEIGRFTMAIPTDEFLACRDELLNHGQRVSQGRRAWVGLYCYSFREHVVIAGVLPGSPGATAGLKSGDVVLAIDGHSVSDRGQLYARLWRRQPGDGIALRLFRDNEVTELVVAAGDAEKFFA